MESPPPSERVPKIALKMMLIVLAAMLFVAIYSNVQRWRREKIENVIVTPEVAPTPTPLSGKGE
jgi:cell division septal protein FtsQ